MPPISYADQSIGLINLRTLLCHTRGAIHQLESILVNGQTADIIIDLYKALRDLQWDKPIRL
ncbi:hypothetical protein LCER1_G007619 [Lachnellula cervina]|uniref:Uncharacterized protein n=1 Tax=Lachnellula cervina TaxID=1316786 RepID=A0A7D8YNV5_9HELO|nr:hypothetical protein LCER1_G007619 [Lachnellula cervina]